MKRLFVAISLSISDDNIECFNKMQECFSRDKIKWSAINNAHLTLKFFGNIRSTDIDGICEQLSKATTAIPPFVLEFGKIGIFGSRYNPRVIWMGFEKCEELLLLEKNIHQQLELIGFKNDRQNFVPHFTLGRVNNIWDKKDFQKVLEEHRYLFSQKIEVGEIQLLESVLTAKGPIYNIVKSFELKGE